MSEDGSVNEVPPPPVDYDALDEATGFRLVEWQAWQDYTAKVLSVPEDDRPDVDTWLDDYAERAHVDAKRIKPLTVLGIFAGPRDEFSQRTGSGRAMYANGDTYEGGYFEGKRHGQGHYVFVHAGRGAIDTAIDARRGTRRAGESTESFVARIAEEIRVGRPIVEAALEWGPHPTYHGEYVRGARVGQGLMKFLDGSVYKGEWANNMRHGRGIVYYPCGDVYSGEWKNGRKDGFGTYRFARGDEYRGEWKEGQIVDGQWVLANGIYYEGTFGPRSRPCDEKGAMHFPVHGIMQRGVYEKGGRWAPQTRLIPCDESPVTEDSWQRSA